MKSFDKHVKQSDLKRSIEHILSNMDFEPYRFTPVKLSDVQIGDMELGNIQKLVIAHREIETDDIELIEYVNDMEYIVSPDRKKYFNMYIRHSEMIEGRYALWMEAPAVSSRKENRKTVFDPERPSFYTWRYSWSFAAHFHVANLPTIKKDFPKILVECFGIYNEFIDSPKPRNYKLFKAISKTDNFKFLSPTEVVMLKIKLKLMKPEDMPDDAMMELI